MIKDLKPFNIDILTMNKSVLGNMREVKDLSIFESSTKNFTIDGLFSTETFGRVGSSERNSNFGYIELHMDIFHPLIYRHITSLKKFYADILTSKKHAKFDNKLKDFVPSTMDDGETGYAFFIKHYEKIKYEDTESDQRDFKIRLLKKHKLEEVLMSKYLVLPAGLRDYTIDTNGQPSEDEVNSLYRKLLTSANALTNVNVKTVDLTIMDPIRVRMQEMAVEIYDHFIALMNGKKKFIEGKWTKRAIRDSTRNVITPIPSKIYDLSDIEANVGFNNTVIGLYQYIKAISPLTKYGLKTQILGRIFDEQSNAATLVDMKSLKTVHAEISSKAKDAWVSDEGLNNTMNKLAQEELRSEAIVVDGYYLALIYDSGKEVKIIFNTNEIPENINVKHLRPITYAELMYLAVYRDVNKYPGFLTRYPVAGLGGIYPSIPYLKTTIKGRRVKVLDFNWEPIDTAYEYPIIGTEFFNSLSPNFTHLDTLDADFDGDKVSYTIMHTEEAAMELLDLMKSRKYYVNPEGKITFSASNNVIDIVTKTLSWDK